MSFSLSVIQMPPRRNLKQETTCASSAGNPCQMNARSCHVTTSFTSAVSDPGSFDSRRVPRVVWTSYRRRTASRLPMLQQHGQQQPMHRNQLLHKLELLLVVSNLLNNMVRMHRTNNYNNRYRVSRVVPLLSGVTHRVTSTSP